MYLILLLLAAPAIFIAINKIKEMHRCPEENELKRVVFGKVNKNSKLADTVIKHLGICQKCRDKVSALNDNKNGPT